MTSKRNQKETTQLSITFQEGKKDRCYNGEVVIFDVKFLFYLNFFVPLRILIKSNLQFPVESSARLFKMVVEKNGEVLSLGETEYYVLLSIIFEDIIDFYQNLREIEHEQGLFGMLTKNRRRIHERHGESNPPVSNIRITSNFSELNWPPIYKETLNTEKFGCSIP